MAKDLQQQIINDLSAGRMAAAQKRAKVLAKKEPTNSAVQNFVGAVFGQSGMHRASAPFFQAAVRAAPDNLEFRRNLILALIMSDEIPAAQKMVDNQLKKHPKSAKLHYLRAFACHYAQEHNAAISAANRALEIEPSLIEALNIRGVAKSELHQTEQALEDFQTILKLNPSDLNALQNCAERLNELGREQDALAHYDAMLNIAPHHSYALSKVASLCDIAALPAVVKAAQDALKNSKLPSNEKATLTMALAVAEDRQGNMQTAMDMYNAVHAIDAKERPYKSSAAWGAFKNISTQFADPISNVPEERAETTPIFVVGLPRSGTTLVEMILTTSAQVHSCGERVTTERMYQEMFASYPAIKPNDVTAFAKLYRDDLKDIPSDATAFVDKMPANFRYIGLLLSAFPDARIVNVQRDPRDVALSMWKQRFSAAGMSYASKLSSIADQANLYRSYMNHWNAIYPDQILSIKYEVLVQDIEGVSRQLATHCGVEWSDAMLRPEQNTNKVRTASVNQVREKLHTRSVAKWRQFGDNLKLLTSKLDPDLWPDIVAGAPKHGSH